MNKIGGNEARMIVSRLEHFTIECFRCFRCFRVSINAV
jgi:hypothetical protein